MGIEQGFRRTPADMDKDAREPRVVAIVQARMSSTRLPNKVLAKIGGHPMLLHVVRRVFLAQTVHDVCVATSTGDADTPIDDRCREQGITCFRGDEEDVLDRFYGAAVAVAATAVVRVTADCPLIDPVVIDKVVGRFAKAIMTT